MNGRRKSREPSIPAHEKVDTPRPDSKPLHGPSTVATEPIEVSHAKYEAIVEAFDGLIYICSPNYEIEFMNDRFIRRTGHNPVGEKCYRALHDREEVCPWCVNERVQRGETVRWEIQSPKDNRWYYVVNTPIRHPNGNISKMAMIQDIHERKKTDEALRKHEQMLGNILSCSPQGISYFENGRLMWCNQAMRDMFRIWRDEEYLGKRPKEFYASDEEYLRVRAMFFQTVAQGKPVEADAKFKRKDDIVFDGHIKIGALDQSEPKKGTIVAISDISDRKRAERALRERTEALARSNKDLEQFAYVAAHDLREPLVAVAAYLKVLERRCGNRIDPEAQSIIKSAMDATMRLDTLIQTLLAYSRVVGDVQSFHPTDCTAVLETVLSNLKSIVEETGTVVTCDSLPTVVGNPSLLVQLFQNLLANAIKFRGEEPPEVHVGATKTEDEWTFSVKDNGIGIEPPYFDRIFLLFQRLHSGPEYAGSGIGLANCRKIVERHGGRIWVESTPGKGSTFFFTIPDNGDN